MNNKKVVWLVWLQGFYFIIMGIWPLIHIVSFMWVSGEKTDIWLVRTVGVLTTSISLCLLSAAFLKELSIPVIVIALCSIISFSLIDVMYVYKEVISEIYLADACIELIFLIMWCVVLYNKWKG